MAKIFPLSLAVSLESLRKCFSKREATAWTQSSCRMPQLMRHPKQGFYSFSIKQNKDWAGLNWIHHGQRCKIMKMLPDAWRSCCTLVSCSQRWIYIILWTVWKCSQQVGQGNEENKLWMRNWFGDTHKLSNTPHGTSCAENMAPSTAGYCVVLLVASSSLYSSSACKRRPWNSSKAARDSLCGPCSCLCTFGSMGRFRRVKWRLVWALRESQCSDHWRNRWCRGICRIGYCPVHNPHKGAHVSFAAASIADISTNAIAFSSDRWDRAQVSSGWRRAWTHAEGALWKSGLEPLRCLLTSFSSTSHFHCSLPCDWQAGITRWPFQGAYHVVPYS